MTTPRQPLMTPEELTAFLDDVFPQVQGQMRIEEVASMRAQVRLLVTEQHLRPGGTISGPSMFMLADCAFYVATLAMIGPEALTVTTNVSINFMRKPAPGDLICEARILKLGRSLSVGDTLLWSEGETLEQAVAQASLTYSIPPAR